MKNKKINIILVAIIILLLAASRLAHHPFNFTPLVAMSLFAGCYLKRQWGIVIPLFGMLVSDYFIGFYDWQVMLSVYVSIIMSFYIGYFLSAHKKWYNVFFSSIVSSILFFLITNFAVWVFFSWYPHNIQGFLLCYSLAIPFFRNTFSGDLFYTTALFGLYELYELGGENIYKHIILKVNKI
jgi:hypothetical protein